MLQYLLSQPDEYQYPFLGLITLKSDTQPQVILTALTYLI